MQRYPLIFFFGLCCTVLYAEKPSINELASIKNEITKLKLRQETLEKQYHKSESDRKKHESEHKFPFLKFTADFYSNLWYGANLELLNSNNSFDQYSFIDYTLDTGFTNIQKQWPKVETPLTFDFKMRFKGVMGDVGHYTQTTSTPIKIGRAMNDVQHSHEIRRLLFWARELWMKYSFNEIDPATSFFKIGLFPFTLGNGFSLGDAHILGKVIPGRFTQEVIDQYRPGMVLSHTITPGYSYLQNYLAFIKMNSAGFNAAGAYTNAQNLETKNKPFRGPFKKSIIVATQLYIDPYGKESEQHAIFKPYFMFFKNNDCAIEFESDSEISLYTLGTVFKYERNGFTFNAEFSKNFGHQKVKAWDRNYVTDSGSTFQTHLFYVPSGTAGVDFTDTNFDTNGVTDPDDFEFSTLFITPNDQAQSKSNGETFAVETSTPGTYDLFKNSYTRFRNAYTNKFTGWMAYIDLMYETGQWSFSGAAGCFSGGSPPNDSEDKIMLTRLSSGHNYQDHNKTYSGFIGVEQMFTGKALRSNFLFEAQKMQQCLCVSNKLTHPLLSNMIFLGCGVNYHKEKEYGFFNGELNIISFLQHTATQKGYNYDLSDSLTLNYTTAHNDDAMKYLDTHLGTEINLHLSGAIAKDVHIFGEFAVFIPGNYYQDANGKYVPIATQVKLAGTDFTGIEDDENRYDVKLGKNPCFLLSFGVRGDFDSNNLEYPRPFKRNYSRRNKK